MDFLEILKNSSSSINDNKQKEKNKQKTNTLKINKKQDDVNDNLQLNTISTYKNIKTGDFIKIVYQKDSILNYYKGYIGEIKEYRKEQDSALIFLHPISTFQLIRFPITHFVKIN